MENNHRTALKSFGKGQGKDKHFQAQMQKVFAALYRQPKTMLMASIETGILRANICRYVHAAPVNWECGVNWLKQQILNKLK